MDTTRCERSALTRLAMAAGLVLLALSLATVGLFLADGTRLKTEIRDDVVAFYWSPDSEKLAYVVLGDAQGMLRWKVLNVADGTT